MNQIGKIIKWDDDKGFGFIKSDRQNFEYFFHISAFKSTGIRPQIGLEVNFKASVDDKGRKQAVNIRAKNIHLSLGPAMKSFIISALFLFAITVAALLDFLPLIIVYLYLFMSVITFINYAWDKSSAKKSRSRISEATLHYLSLFGGWPGALFAQQFLRHKSIKKSFRIVFWITLILNISSLIYLLSAYGKWILQIINQMTVLS